VTVVIVVNFYRKVVWMKFGLVVVVVGVVQRLEVEVGKTVALFDVMEGLLPLVEVYFENFLWGSMTQLALCCYLPMVRAHVPGGLFAERSCSSVQKYELLGSFHLLKVNIHFSHVLLFGF
jgi:hypothetical protein